MRTIGKGCQQARNVQIALQDANAVRGVCALESSSEKNNLYLIFVTGSTQVFHMKYFSINFLQSTCMVHTWSSW